MLVALAEMALAGGLGVELQEGDSFAGGAGFFFGEDQASYIVEIEPSNEDALIEGTKRSGLSLLPLGIVGGRSLLLKPSTNGLRGGFDISLTDLRAAHESFFPKLMGSELTPEF